MSYEIGNPQMFWLLLCAPSALILMAYSAWIRRKALRTFYAKPTARQSIRGVVSAISLFCGIVLLALACTDIRWGKTTREVPQKGLEVVFALDVSRSMLAQDARPNRLARAKQQINDMIGEMAGDRIGLVVFAGEAKQAIPLTNHYGDFRQKLATVGPHSVSTGGSQLGVAIKAAADAFLSKTSDHKTVILFTDGEDQESKPIELAQRLFSESAMRIFTVGLGDIEKGARVPQDRRGSKQFIEHQGQQVWSKLNGRILKQIATETQAAYIPAGTKRVNMADVYHNFIANIEKSEFESAKINAFIPRFQWFAFPAFVCLCVYGWLATAQNQNNASRAPLLDKRSQPGLPPNKLGSTKSQVAVVLLVLALLTDTAIAQSVTDSTARTVAGGSVAAQINAANGLVRQDKYTEAIQAFNAIQTATPNEQDSVNYNLAVAHYGNSDFDAAISLLRESATSNNDRIAADSRYNIGNCHFAKSLPLASKPDAAIQELGQAVEHYRSAISLDRKHSDARENLERATKLIDQLRQQEQQQDSTDQDQEQENDQGQDDKQSDDSDQDQQQEQSENSEQSEQNQDQTDSNQEQPGQPDKSNDSESQADGKEDSEEKQSQSEQDQSQQKPDGENQPDQSEESQSQDNPQESPDSKDDSSNNQSDSASQPQQRNKPESGESSEQSDPEESEASEKEGKQPPQGDITEANESKSGDADAQPLLEQSEENQNEEGKMSRQEALKLLQAVRDRDMLRRLQQQQRQRNRRVRVEKDW